MCIICTCVLLDIPSTPIDAIKQDFNDIMKNVNAFIRDSQQVIYQLNSEIQKSNITLDQIALDAEKMDLLSGEEEKEIDDLESQLGNGVVVFPNNAKYSEEDSSEDAVKFFGIGDISKKVKNIISGENTTRSVKDEVSINYERDQKLGGIFGNMFKSQNRQIVRPVKGGAHEVKILGDTGNGSTVCIILRPYECLETTPKSAVSFINYDPFMDPPMKGVNVSDKNRYNDGQKNFTTQTNFESSISSNISSPHETTPMLSHNFSTVQLFKTGETPKAVTNKFRLLDRWNYFATLSSPLTVNLTTNSLINYIPIENTAANIPSVSVTFAPTIKDGNVNITLSTTNYMSSSKSSNLDISSAALQNSSSLKPIYFQLNTLATTQISPRFQNTLPYSTTMKVKKNNWKLFGKGKNTNFIETPSPKNHSNISTDKIEVVTKRDKETDKNRNGTLLVLVYNVQPGDKNKTLLNIESMNLFRNVSSETTTMKPINNASETTNSLPKSAINNIIAELFSNVAIHGSNAAEEGVDRVRNSSNNLNTTLIEQLSSKDFENPPERSRVETLSNNEAVEMLNSLKSEISSINVTNPDSLHNLESLLNGLRNIILKRPADSESDTSPNSSSNNPQNTKDKIETRKESNSRNQSVELLNIALNKISSITPVDPSEVWLFGTMKSISGDSKFSTTSAANANDISTYQTQVSISGSSPGLLKPDSGIPNLKKHRVIKRIIFLNVPSQKKKEWNRLQFLDKSHIKCYMRNKVNPLTGKELDKPFEVYVLDPDVTFLKKMS